MPSWTVAQTEKRSPQRETKAGLETAIPVSFCLPDEHFSKEWPSVNQMRLERYIKFWGPAALIKRVKLLLCKQWGTEGTNDIQGTPSAHTPHCSEFLLVGMITLQSIRRQCHVTSSDV